MDIPSIAEELAENLRELGWHIDAEQKKCPNRDCKNKNYSTTMDYCPYCGEELECTNDDGEQDVEEALREIEGIEEQFE